MWTVPVTARAVAQPELPGRDSEVKSESPAKCPAGSVAGKGGDLLDGAPATHPQVASGVHHQLTAKAPVAEPESALEVPPECRERAVSGSRRCSLGREVRKRAALEMPDQERYARISEGTPERLRLDHSPRREREGPIHAPNPFPPALEV